MDRQGYEGVGTYDQSGDNKPLGQKIKEVIPGTEEHRMRESGTMSYSHDTMGSNTGPSVGERVKAAIPGTEEHRMREAQPMGAGGDYAGTGTGYSGGAGLGSTGMGGTGLGSTGMGTGGMGTGGMGTGYTEPTGMSTGAAIGSSLGGSGPAGTDYGRTGTTGYTDPSMGTMSAGDRLHEGGVGREGEDKSMGQKIKELIPGTEEHKMKKIEEGRM